MTVFPLLAVSACRGDALPEMSDRVGTMNASAVASPAPDASVLAASEVALRAFLDASRETTPDPASLDTLTACGDGGHSYFPSTLLAGYTLLPFESRGDTIVGRAEVVTVAELDIDRRSGRGFIGRERVRSDVLEWDIFRDDDGHLVVCNGLRFGARGADTLTTWRPEGASYASVRHLADSIAAVRR